MKKETPLNYYRIIMVCAIICDNDSAGVLDEAIQNLFFNLRLHAALLFVQLVKWSGNRNGEIPCVLYEDKYREYKKKLCCYLHSPLG